MSSVRRMLYPSRPYLLRDDFNDDRAAGALNGVTVPAVPGPGTRTGVDTESKISISGGQLVGTGGKAVPAWGDPAVWDKAHTRLAGKTLLAKWTLTAGTDIMIGWDTAQAGLISAHGLYWSSLDTLIIYDNVTSVTVAAPVAGTTYQIAVVLRSTGAYYFIKGGTFATWTRLFSTNVLNTATLYPGIVNNKCVFTADYIRVPARLWLPPVLAHDTFTRADT